jgi:RimJ/RimL family protein N-acetyltransferase
MIELKPLHENHAHYFYNWIQDEEVIRYSLSIFQKLKTKEQVRTWLLDTIKDTSTFKKGVFLKGTDQLIGYAGICDLSSTNKSGEYFIFIGDKSYWGKGVGTEVTTKVLQLGFNDLDLNRIMLTVSEPNIGGVKAYQRAGFKLEGKLRQACFRDGKFHDKLVMSVLKEELG